MKQAFSFPKSSEKRPGFRSGCKAVNFSGVANRTKPNKKSMEPDSVKNPGEGPGAPWILRRGFAVDSSLEELIKVKVIFILSQGMFR